MQILKRPCGLCRRSLREIGQNIWNSLISDGFVFWICQFPNFEKGSIWGASPLRTTVCRLPGRGFFYVTFAPKHVFWWFAIEMILKCYQHVELLPEMVSWTLQNFGRYPKCFKCSSQSRPVANLVPGSRYPLLIEFESVLIEDLSKAYFDILILFWKCCKSIK